MISGFRCEVDVNCALLGYHTVSSGNFLLMFQDNLSVPSSRVKRKVGLIDCPEMSLTLCRSNLKLYCVGRKAAFFSVGI